MFRMFRMSCAEYAHSMHTLGRSPVLNKRLHLYILLPQSLQ